jgi:hypothetical protein
MIFDGKNRNAKLLKPMADDTYHASSTEEVSSSPTTSQGRSMQVRPDLEI